MTKEMWLSILRSVLTLGGTFLVGHSLLGHTVDAGTFETISGSVLALVGTIWGIVTKTTTADQISSAARSILIGLGGVGVSWGLISSNTMVAISSFVTSILPIILSQTAKVTAQNISDGKVSVDPTGKLVKAVPPASPPKQ